MKYIESSANAKGKTVLTTDMFDDMFKAENSHGGDFKYVAPPTESAKMALEAAAAEREKIASEAWQRYADRAKEKTATEIAQDERAGREAFLEWLAAQVVEIVQNCLWLTEQIEFPGRFERWGQATFTVKGTFKPAVPEDDQKKREAERFETYGRSFGSTVAMQLAKDGIPETEEARMELVQKNAENVGEEVLEQ